MLPLQAVVSVVVFEAKTGAKPSSEIRAGLRWTLMLPLQASVSVVFVAKTRAKASSEIRAGLRWTLMLPLQPSVSVVFVAKMGVKACCWAKIFLLDCHDIADDAQVRMVILELISCLGMQVGHYDLLAAASPADNSTESLQEHC
jgi:hypothetical protein